MKAQKLNWFEAMLLFLLTAIVVMAALSCGVSKNKSQSQTNTVSELLKEKNDSIRVLKNENNVLLQQIRELTYAGISFDTSDCPETSYVIPKDCNVDSILRILDRYRDQVKVYADGTIEINAKLKNITYTKERLESKIQMMQRTIDSLTRLKEKVNVVTETKTVTKDKIVKRGGWWWGFFIGGLLFTILTVLFLFAYNKYREKQLLIHK